MRKKLVSLLLTGSVVMTSFSTNIAFASERYSAYKDNIDFSKYKDVTDRLKSITKQFAGKESTAAQYEYNDKEKITLRNYPEGTIQYEYNSDGKVVKVLNKLKKIDEENKPSIIHVKENSISEYTYDTDGKIVREIKKVFEDSNLYGEPKQIYEINYYYDGDKLCKKSYKIENDSYETEYQYTNERIDKIIEYKNNEISQSMTLEYDDDGDIIKAVQTKNGRQITREFSYVENSVYPIYFVDPVKEHKVDLDFFASSYKLIKEMKIIDEKGTKLFKYEYDNEKLPTESEVTFSLNDTEYPKTKYLLKYK